MAHRRLQHTLDRLSRAAADAEQPAAEAVRRLSGDISACVDKVLKLRAAQLVQLRVPYHLGRIAMLPLRVLAAAETELPNVDADVLRTLHELSDASGEVASTCKAADQEPCLPPDLVTVWTAAARKVVAHLQQQHPRRRDGSRQQASIPAAVQQLLATLLLLWHNVFTSVPYTTPLASTAAAACASDAAELAVMLLTCTPEADAAQQSKASFSDLQGEAAFVLHLLADSLFYKGDEIAADAGSCSPGPHTLALVSDSVQEALALHLAILLAYHHEQQEAAHGGSSSSTTTTNSLVAAASHAWLQSAGFPQDRCARWYADNISKTFTTLQPAAGGSSRHSAAAQVHPPHMQVTALEALQQVLMSRAAAVARPGWQKRCRGLIAAADTSVDPVPLDGIGLLTGLPEAVRRDGRLYAPGVCHSLLQRLVVEAASVCCWGPNAAKSVNAAMNLLTFYLQPTTPLAGLDPLAARAVLPPLWLGLGQALLAASGAAVSEAQNVEHCWQDPHQKMWGMYSTTLFMTVAWLISVYGVQQPMEISSEQVGLARRVLEAAVRASRAHGVVIDTHESIHCDVLCGLALGLVSCGPRHLPAASHRELHSQPSRASRCCGLLVSVAKDLERRAALDSVGPGLLAHLAGVTTGTVPPILDLAEQLQEGSATPEDLPFLAGPGSTAWLFAIGRVLVTVARLLQLVPLWRVRPLKPPTRRNLVELVIFVMWLERIGALLRAMQHQLEVGGAAATTTPAAAAATSIKAVAAAESKVAVLLHAYCPLFDQLLDTVVALEQGGGRNSQQLSAALGALSAACTPQGGLPADLEAVGASLCAAFPQRFACNNPACGSTEGMSEAVCAKNKCSACQVARYCCKEHQLSHWPNHKRVCKHLRTLLPATGSATAARGKAPST